MYEGFKWVLSAALYVVWCAAIFQRRAYLTLAAGLLFFIYSFMAHGSLARDIADAFGEAFGPRDTSTGAKWLCGVVIVAIITTAVTIAMVVQRVN
ncbi:MAG: hypothetical protein ABI155_14390 [Paralcaligenes sp.]